MHNGIVIEMKGKTILIMTPDGQFKQIAKQQRSYQLGEEISFVDTYKKPILNWRAPNTFTIAAASVFCIMIVALLSIFGEGTSTNKVAAYVTMDINPSIEVGIDKEENVIEIRGINDDGKDLLKDVVYKGLSLDAFSDLIVQKIELGHYFDSGNTNIIIASTVMNKNQNDYEAELAEKVKTKFIAAFNKTHVAPKEEIVVTAITAPQEVRKEAVAQGVSTGKKAVQLLTQKNIKSTTDEDLKDKPIQQMIIENGGIDKIVPKDHKVTKEEFKSLLKEQRDKNDNRKKEESKKNESKINESKINESKINESKKEEGKDESKKEEREDDENRNDDSRNDENDKDDSGKIEGEENVRLNLLLDNDNDNARGILQEKIEKNQREWAKEQEEEKEKMWENMQVQLKEKLKKDQRKEKDLENNKKNDIESNNKTDQEEDRNGRTDRSDGEDDEERDNEDRKDLIDRIDRNNQNDENGRDRDSNKNDKNDRDNRDDLNSRNGRESDSR